MPSRSPGPAGPAPDDRTSSPDPVLLPDAAGLPLNDPALVRALFDGSPAGIGLFDEDARYLRANRSLQSIVGLPEDRMIGRRVSDVVPGLLGTLADALLREVLASGRSMQPRELEGEVAGLAGARTFLVSYLALKGERGMPRAASIVVDISEGRRTTLALARAVGRLELLGRAAAVLAEPFDLDRTLAELADLVVPTLADHCLVDLVIDGTLRRAAARHSPGLDPLDGEGAVHVGEAVKYSPGFPGIQALSTQGPLLHHLDPTTSMPESWSGLARAAYARRVGMHSVVAAALSARGQVVGLLTMARSISPQPYTTSDAELAGQLADRAGVAIDTALLFARQQETALRLQRSLMPRSLPAVDGARLAARYLPAGERAEVGGDWYDVVCLQAGRVAVVIGDVMGRGLPAAALMGQVRAGLRAYAVQDLPPADVLAHADELVRGLDEAALVTCVYAVLDPREATLTLASAGHVPAMLVGAGSSPDGSGAGPGDDPQAAVAVLPATGPPLGAGGLTEGPRYGQRTLRLNDGATLTLVTDGLLERRETSLTEGLARLEAVVEGLAATGVQAGADALLDAFGIGGPDLDPDDRDDVAVLLLRFAAATAPRSLVLRVPPDAAQVRAAREAAVDAVRGWLAEEGPGDDAAREQVVDDVQLLVSELVTNAVRHAGTDAELIVSRHRDTVVLEVRDGREATPRWRRADVDDEGGRGMFLVGQLAQEWGVRALRGEGKAVWCVLAAPHTQGKSVTA